MKKRTMNIIIRTIILFVAVLAIAGSSYSQTNTKSGLVTVNLSIVGKGRPTVCSDSSNYYFAYLKVLNTQDTAIKFWIMSCSWATDNFVVNNDAVSFRFCGCDSNIPVEIILPPQKIIEFYTTIKYRKSESLVGQIKVGFIYFTNSKDIFNVASVNGRSIKANKFWSNEVELRDNLYSYEIK